jgi:flagellar protein FlaG
MKIDSVSMDTSKLGAMLENAVKQTEKKTQSNSQQTSNSSTQQPVTKEEATKAVEKLNELAGVFDKSIKFTVEDGKNSFRIKVINPKTDEVIRELPAESVVNAINSIRESVGVIVDEKI